MEMMSFLYDMKIFVIRQPLHQGIINSIEISNFEKQSCSFHPHKSQLH